MGLLEGPLFHVTFEKLRFVTAVAVIGLVVLAIGLIGHATYDVYELVWSWMQGHGKYPAVQALYITDVYLVSVVILMLAMGLTKLFLDANVPMPEWMNITGLDTLKTKVIRAIVLVLAVTFVKQVSSAESGQEIALFGAGIGAMVVALAVFVRSDSKPPTDATKAQ